MSNTTKPEQTDQTPEAGNNDKKTTALYDRFVDLTREAFEVGHEKSHEAWEKAMEVSRQKLTVNSAPSRARHSSVFFAGISSRRELKCSVWARRQRMFSIPRAWVRARYRHWPKYCMPQAKL